MNQACSGMKIENLMKASHVPGLAVVYRKPGEEARFCSFGSTGGDAARPVDRHTLFEACSLTKPLFALYVLYFLRERGISPDAPVLSLLKPEREKEALLFGYYAVNERLRRVTFRQALSHSSGLPNWGRKDTLELQAEPGQWFSYSGEGYMILQRLIADHLTMPVESAIEEAVLKPLGMADSTFVWSGPGRDNTALGHDPEGRTLDKRQWTLNGAASLHTSTADYLKFARLFTESDGVFAPLIAEMKRPVISVNRNQEWDGRYHSELEEQFPGLHWGAGIGIEETESGSRWFHWGHQSGYRSLFCADSSGRLLVFLANGSNIKQLRRSLLTLAGDLPGRMVEWLELD